MKFTDTLSPIYVVAGDEYLQVQECMAQIKSQAQQQGFDERDTFTVSGNFNWDKISNSIDNLSLFSPKKIIEIHLPTNKPGKSGSTFLKNYAQHPIHDIIVILMCGKLDGATQKSAWLKALEGAGTLIKIWPKEGKDLIQWLTQRAKSNGLTLEPEALTLLANEVEGNLSAAAQEIEKLILNFGTDKRLTLSQVQQVIGNNSKYDIFKLADTVLAGDLKRALKLLHQLKSQGTEPILILWAITKDIRVLLNAHQGDTKGIWPSRKPLIQQALKRLNTKSLEDLILQCYHLDQTIKGLHQSNVWFELERLIITATS